MLNLFKWVLAVAVLLAAHQGWASRFSEIPLPVSACQILFDEPGYSSMPIKLSPSVRERQTPVQVMIQVHIDIISSPEQLARVFAQIINPQTAESRQILTELADSLFRQLGGFGVQQVARSLMLNHLPVAEVAVQKMLLKFLVDPKQSAFALISDLPKPTELSTFSRWIELGQRFLTNGAFQSNLHNAMRDYRAYNSSVSSRMSLNETDQDFNFGLSTLGDPSVVGRFIETFMRADRLTRQFIFLSAVDLQYLTDGRVTATLKGTQSREPHAVASALTELLSRSLASLEEDAYFGYVGQGWQTAPALHDVEQTKNVALGFLARMNYDLTKFRVEYAAKVLAGLPIASRDIDIAMSRLLASGAKIQDPPQHTLLLYATQELRILDRHAGHLTEVDFSRTKPTFEFTRRALSSNLIYEKFLRELLDTHANYDIRNYPELRVLVVDFLRQHPNALSIVAKPPPGEIEALKRDLGL